MPILSSKPTAPAAAPAAIPRIESPKSHTSVVDTRYTPMSRLITFIEGRRYTVDYYSQVRGRDDTVYGQDATKSSIYQAYRKISKLELRMTQPLDASQDNESKEFTVRGEAVMHSHVIPNEGDMFAADVGDGREGIFEILESKKLSHYKDSAYSVSFTLAYYSEQKPAERKDLEDKVIESLHYLRDFIRLGQNPLVTTNQFHVLEQLVEYKQLAINTWFDQFYSREFSTVLVPGQEDITYDAFVLRAMRQMVTTDDHPNIIYTRELNIEDDSPLKQHQLWSVLMQREYELLPEANKKMGSVSSLIFSRDAMQEGIRFSGIQRVIYPIWENAPVDQGYNHLTKIPEISSPLRPVSSTVGAVQVPPLEDTITLGAVELPLIKSVTVDDYYVLSHSFYEDTSGKSVLEVLVQNALQDESLDYELVLQLAKTHKRWGGLEKFYYIPLLVFLIRISLKDW